MAKKAIEERLDEQFLRHYYYRLPFDITGSKRVYGVLYSTFDNEREERNLTFRRAVVDNLEKKYSKMASGAEFKNILNINSMVKQLRAEAWFHCWSH